MGERDQDTFDTPQEALDFKAKLRLMKRRDNLDELDAGQQTLVEFMPEFWRSPPGSTSRPQRRLLAKFDDQVSQST